MKIDSVRSMNTFCTLLFAACVISSLLGFLVISAPLLALGLILYWKKLHDKQSVRQVESDTVHFLDSLIDAYSKAGSLRSALQTAAKGNYIFTKDLQTAINGYEKGIRATAAFLQLKKYGSDYLDEAIGVIADGLSSGTDVSASIVSIRESAAQNDKYMIKNIGVFENAMVINKIGNAVFFPVFAGVGMNIIKFTGTLGGSVQNANAAGIGILFVAYLLLANYIIVIYDRKGSKANILTRMALLWAVSIFLFNITSYFAFTFIGE